MHTSWIHIFSKCVLYYLIYLIDLDIYLVSFIYLFIYFKYKFVVENLIALQIPLHKVVNYFPCISLMYTILETVWNKRCSSKATAHILYHTLLRRTSAQSFITYSGNETRIIAKLFKTYNMKVAFKTSTLQKNTYAPNGTLLSYIIKVGYTD